MKLLNAGLMALVLFCPAAPVCRADAETLAERANALESKGKLVQALETYRSAQAENPTDPVLCYNLGRIHYRLGNFLQAAETFLKAAPNAQGALAANAFFNAGNAYFKMGMFKEAVEQYKRALRLDWRDADAKINLELALVRLQEAEKARNKRLSERRFDRRGEESSAQKGSSRDKKSPPQERETLSAETGAIQEQDGQKDKASAEGQPVMGVQTVISFEDAMKLLETISRQERNQRHEQARRSVQAGPGRVEKDW